jgi:ATP-dependent Clp protease protease subunit
MTNDEEQPLFDYRLRERFFSQRILVLDGALDDDNGTVLATQLLSLASEDPSRDIALWIHSTGGSVPAMLAIRDVMRLVPCDVATLALGLACSAGQFLLSAGTLGKRFALPHARILMHQGSAGIGGRGGGGGGGGRPAAHPGHSARDHRGRHQPADRPDLRRLSARPLVHHRASM